jgi:hypothetical protein
MKKLITNYTFAAVAWTVRLDDYTTILREGILLITNVTDNVIIYNFADPLKGGTVVGNVITLTHDTSLMDNGDDLQVLYDDGVDLPAGAATSAGQAVLESLVDTLHELTARLAVMASWASGGAAGVRVVGVSMPSTAVTGPQTSAQFIATFPVGGVNYTRRMAAENMNAVLSNIDNTVGV